MDVASMRTLVLVATTLALLTLVPAPAQAQLSSQVTMTLTAPTEPLKADGTLTFTGAVTYTADYTAMLALTGIPVQYAVSEKPEWATVIVSPANDVFPAPVGPSSGLAYSVTRMITVTVTLARALEEDASGAIVITATTSPAPLGQAAMGQGAVPILYDAPDKECQGPANAQLLEMAREAANEYAEKGGNVDVPTAAPATEAPAEELRVQSGGASPLALPWIAVAGFAIVGAGVGLLLKKRLGR